MTTTKLTGLAAASILSMALTAPGLALAGPIHDAARNADIGLVASLIKGGADIDERNADGSTPLIVAAQGGETQLVEVLLMLGADTETYNDGGMTALRAAVIAGDTDSIKLLQVARAALLRCGQ